MNLRRILPSALLLAVTAPLGAVLDFQESVSGDLSNDGAAPTALSFETGVNRITGTMGRDTNGVVDPDIFTFTVQPGFQLTSLNILSMVPQENSFFAIGAGASIAMNSGETHLSNRLVNQPGEQLSLLAASKEFGGQSMLTDPAGAGVYTVWFQELAGRVDYEMEFTVAAIPEPSTIALIAGGVVGLAAVIVRRRRIA